jgi:hypothetical protein
MEHGKHTREREVQAPEGIDRASESGAGRVNCPLERYFRHLGSELVQAGNWFIDLHRAMEKRLTPAWTGLPVQAIELGARSGGVDDDERANSAALAFVEARLEAEFREVLDVLLQKDEKVKGRPRTVADLGHRFLTYKGKDDAQPAGVAMLRFALVRLRSIQEELRSATAETPEMAARRLKAKTAQEQYQRERWASKSEDGAPK